MYTVFLITSSAFEDLNFLILPKIDGISNIEKTIIIINNIKKNRALAIYFQTFLPDKLKNRDKNIIKYFLLMLEVTIKTNWLKKFPTNNTKIIICTDIAKIRVNIPVLFNEKLLIILFLSQFFSKLDV